MSDAPSIRPPAVAGLFYPDDPLALREIVQSCLDAALVPPHPPQLRALIAPHAGYLYSGPIAGTAFANLRGVHSITTVIVIGPSHHLHFDGIATTPARAFATPLGEIPLHPPARETLRSFPWIVSLPEAHRNEHAIEVELPFLQVVLPQADLIPLVTGKATPQQVAQTLAALATTDATLILVSSDLSHYLPQRAAVTLDRQTADAIEARTPQRISPHQACGHLAIQGLLLEAQRRSLIPQTLDLRTSADTAGEPQRVVGYGAFSFSSS
ncbi:MAG TPA: AmmeMemoRadiSam system protein B [Kiritimatiellia bacterium]|nr:AmmeMemoRadiSam system protein B [Kiritimatiellia bacterium]